MHTLLPLGINGYYPSHGRHTTSFLFITGRQAVLLDAGTGVARLAEPAVRGVLAGCERFDVLLSHYHVDHVVGLFYLPAVWPDRPLRIHGPARPWVDTTPRDAIGQLISPPLCPKPLEEMMGDVEVYDIQDDRYVLGDLEVRVWGQEHPGGSIGVRFGDTLAYMTDRSMDQAQQEHARGVGLLLHELWLTDAEAAESPEKLSVHSHLGAVAEFARGAGAQRLMPMHHHPSRTARDIEALCHDLQDAAGVPVVVPEEGSAYRWE
jgi:ribonuclease BN (tRNA processing enzyme)